MSTKTIKSNLAEESLGGEWEKESQLSPKLDTSPHIDRAIDQLRSVVGASGKSVKEVAFDLGMSETHLADHLAGRRVIASHRIMRFVERNPETAIAAAEAILRAAKISAVIKRKKVTPHAARKQMQLELGKSADVCDLIAEKAARALGASKQEVLDAWNEEADVTGEIVIGR